MRLTASVLTGIFLPVNALAQSLGGQPPGTDLRLDLGQLYSADDLTGRHLSFSELRGTIDARRELGEGRIELHLDGRGRLGWTDVTTQRGDVSRAFLTFGSKDDGWSASVGRHTIDAAHSARVDGASIEVALSDRLHGVAFGGAAPHPITGALDPRFLTAGAGYDLRGTTLQHSGGVVASWYRGGLDRLYLSERVYWRASEQWILYGQAVIDLLSTSGFLGDLAGMPREEQRGLARIDLTQANLTVRFRPVAALDLSLNGAHHHALLPNLWWQDYLEQERARRGFVLDGAEPAGSRRSTVRAVAELHLGPVFTPYVIARGDHRHDDGASGWEGTLGSKLDLPELGYADLSGTLREVFGAENQLGALVVGSSFASAFGFDLSATMLRVVPVPLEGAAASAELLYDLGAALWLDLHAIADPLGNLRLMALYQAFVDPELVFQVVFLKIGYRFRAL